MDAPRRTTAMADSSPSMQAAWLRGGGLLASAFQRLAVAVAFTDGVDDTDILWRVARSFKLPELAVVERAQIERAQIELAHIERARALARRGHVATPRTCYSPVPREDAYAGVWWLALPPEVTMRVLAALPFGSVAAAARVCGLWPEF